MACGISSTNCNHRAHSPWVELPAGKRDPHPQLIHGLPTLDVSKAVLLRERSPDQQHRHRLVPTWTYSAGGAQEPMSPQALQLMLMYTQVENHCLRHNGLSLHQCPRIFLVTDIKYNSCKILAAEYICLLNCMQNACQEDSGGSFCKAFLSPAVLSPSLWRLHMPSIHFESTSTPTLFT